MLISRSRYIPYVVEVDKLGYALTVAQPLTPASVPHVTERMRRYEVAAFILNARSVTSDAEVEHQMLDSLLAHARGAARSGAFSMPTVTCCSKGGSFFELETLMAMGPKVVVTGGYIPVPPDGHGIWENIFRPRVIFYCACEFPSLDGALACHRRTMLISCSHTLKRLADLFRLQDRGDPPATLTRVESHWTQHLVA